MPSVSQPELKSATSSIAVSKYKDVVLSPESAKSWLWAILLMPIIIGIGVPGYWWIYTLAILSVAAVYAQIIERWGDWWIGAVDVSSRKDLRKFASARMLQNAISGNLYSLPNLMLAFAPAPGPAIGYAIATIGLLRRLSQKTTTRETASLTNIVINACLVVNALAIGGWVGPVLAVLGIVLSTVTISRANAIPISELMWRQSELEAAGLALEQRVAERTSELREETQKAASANIAKSQFLANMSHELRTPLNAIIGYSEIMCEGACDDARETDIKDHGRVLVAARSLLTLINEILDLSKIEAGKMDVFIGDFDIRGLVEDAVALITPKAEENGNVLKIEIDPLLEIGRSDAFKINQCLLNLLSNACKFTKNGIIEVRACLLSEGLYESLQISVSDTGIGMTEKQVARLFQSFTQADASITREFGGTGLGLTIAKSMAQLMGGDILLKTAKGEGSKFTLQVALNLETYGEAALHGEADCHEEDDRPAVLVIDDDADVADLITRSISQLGFRILSATSAAAGIRAAEASNPAIVLLDINLPDKSGWAALEDLMASPSTKDIPVIIHSIHDDRKRALEMGACDMLVKPCDRTVLIAAVTRYARISRAKLLEVSDSGAFALNDQKVI